MLAKPQSCSGCPLQTAGQGWVFSSGPPDASLVAIGEAAGKMEAIHGIPLHPTGESGGMFGRWLNYEGLRREDLLLHNVISCRPPGNELVGMGYAETAIRHCRPNLEQTLSRPSIKAVLALGGTATRELLDIPPGDFSIKDWHGCPTRDPLDRFWVVPTFHPAHLTRGAFALLGIAVADLRKARQIAANGWAGEPAELIVDPPLEWFRAWAAEYFRALAQNPLLLLACDIETAEKLRVTDEGELKQDLSTEITRMNLSMHPNQGVSVRYIGGFIEIIKEILEGLGPKAWWNRIYDLTHIWRAGIHPRGQNYDFMWAWHVLQTDLPRGLGFVAPLFSGLGAWKHLASTDEGRYAAADAVQTLRSAFGIMKLLVSEGRWDAFFRHSHLCHDYLFWPMCKEGLLVDRARLEGTPGPDGQLQGGYKQEVDVLVDGLWNTIQELVPKSIQRLDPKDGLKREPESTERKNPDHENNPGSPEFLPLVMIPTVSQVKECETCGALEVSVKHVCKGASGKPDRSMIPVIVRRQIEVPRWFIRRQFNPNSPDQVLEAVLAFHHTPGKSKSAKSKTGFTVDKLTMQRLAAHAQPPETRGFYRSILEYRECKKIKSTYVDATLRRLDESPEQDNRLHGEVTDRPSTLRTSMLNPNLQNLAARSKLSEGFRECLIAGDDLQ